MEAAVLYRIVPVRMHCHTAALYIVVLYIENLLARARAASVQKSIENIKYS